MQRQEGALEARLDRDRGVEMRRDMREVIFLARGVDDEHQPIIGSRDDQIVEDAARLVEQQRVAHPAWREALQIAWNQRLKGARRRSAEEPDLAHMRDIEEAGVGAGMEMLGDDARGVLHRHLIAGKGDHAGAQRAVQIVKRGVPQRRRFGRTRHRRTSGRADAGCVREMPPLSWALRDSPDPAASCDRAAAYSFGERPSRATRPPLSRAPFPPQSFCLRVSGAVAPSAPRPLNSPQGATSPAGVHTAPLCSTAGRTEASRSGIGPKDQSPRKCR